MRCLEADLDYSSVRVKHMNSVDDYYVFNRSQKCFVCGSSIAEGKFPYPSLSLYFGPDPEGLSRAIMLFEESGSSSSIVGGKYDVPASHYGADVAACTSHAENLRKLRTLFKARDIKYDHTGRITPQAIKEAMLS